jgi:LysM repeat protein
MKTKLKISSLFTRKRKRLRATTARRPLRIAAAARGEELTEPNMKLSRALLIVLLLHVVAVAGILAFNAIKTRQGSTASVAVAANPANQTVGSTPKNPSPNPPSASVGKDAAERDASKLSRSGAKSTAKDVKTPSSSGKSYTVAKGDNPVTIAKKFKVSYDDLLALNHIEDPRKLKVGQKLLIPTKTTKAKRTDE